MTMLETMTSYGHQPLEEASRAGRVTILGGFQNLTGENPARSAPAWKLVLLGVECCARWPPEIPVIPSLSGILLWNPNAMSMGNPGVWMVPYQIQNHWCIYGISHPILPCWQVISARVKMRHRKEHSIIWQGSDVLNWSKVIFHGPFVFLTLWATELKLCEMRNFTTQRQGCDDHSSSSVNLLDSSAHKWGLWTCTQCKTKRHWARHLPKWHLVPKLGWMREFAKAPWWKENPSSVLVLNPLTLKEIRVERNSIFPEGSTSSVLQKEYGLEKDAMEWDSTRRC